MTEEKMEVKCPVCGREMEVSKVGVLYGAVAGKPRATSTYKDKIYYFDRKACKKEFDESPEKFIKG
ncbi:MAG: YHS domain-containing protein [Thermodesulfobacteriota bacterium]|nr:YHS domain-containing protein [Thermodesulfobacteriota bacterium]